MPLCAALLILLMAVPAVAHDPYGAWKNPTTGASCCDNRDCRARMDDNERWEAWDGWRWIKIPPANVLRMKSPDGRSHLCEMNGAVFCFVPGEPRS
jgi:hypothetical protein